MDEQLYRELKAAAEKLDKSLSLYLVGFGFRGEWNDDLNPIAENREKVHAVLDKIHAAETGEKQEKKL